MPNAYVLLVGPRELTTCDILGLWVPDSTLTVFISLLLNGLTVNLVEAGL